MMYRRISILRRQAQMSQLQLAEALHVSASTIGMYEQGRRIPGLDILIRMSHVFGVSLDYLVTGNDFTSSADEFDSYHFADHCPCSTCYWKEYRLRYTK